jgi:hypothetical protein
VAQELHRTGKFFLFLRAVRAELFDEEFQTELAAAYQPRGTSPMPRRRRRCRRHCRRSAAC